MKAKKNISILIISLANGGGERNAAVLANYLAQTHNVNITLLNDTIKFEIDPKVTINYLENKPLHGTTLFSIIKIPYLAFKYSLYCKKNNIDTSIAFLARTNLIASFSKCFGNKAKVIVNELTTLSKMYPNTNLKNKMMIQLIKWGYGKADKVVANAKGVEQELKQMYGMQNTVCIYNPFDTKVLTATTDNVNFSDLDFSHFTFITIARFIFPKDYDTLLRAFSLIKNKNAQLVIIGVGEDLEKSKALCQTLRIAKRVKFLGYVESPYPYLKRSNCMVFSSFFEGFPNALLEGLASGLPLISTDCKNGPREIIAPSESLEKDLFISKPFHIGESGILVPVKDKNAFALAMDYAMEHPNKLKEFTNNGHKIFTTFNSETVFRKFFKLIET